SFSYSPAGLLRAMTNPRSNLWNFSYDALGRLTEDRDPAGEFKALALSEGTGNFSVEIQTALGRTNRYEVMDLPTGGQKRVTTFLTALRNELWHGKGGGRKQR